jgi:hypothetical protein
MLLAANIKAWSALATDAKADRMHVPGAIGMDPDEFD